MFLHYTRWHPDVRPPDVATIFPRTTPEDGTRNEDLVGAVLARRAEEDVQRTWTLGSGRVYFLQAGDPTRPVKIGWSIKLGERISELQIGCPDPLRVLRTIVAEEAEEGRLHERFKGIHIHGEWFRAEPELLEFLLRL